MVVAPVSGPARKRPPVRERERAGLAARLAGIGARPGMGTGVQLSA